MYVYDIKNFAKNNKKLENLAQFKKYTQQYIIRIYIFTQAWEWVWFVYY